MRRAGLALGLMWCGIAPSFGAPQEEGPPPVPVERQSLVSQRARREFVARRKGGSRATERAVDDALDWLARHQETDGHWSCMQFAARCKRTPCGGPGEHAEWDAGCTGLALLAFTGAGCRPGTGKHGKVVQAAIDYLVGVQRDNGCLGELGDGRLGQMYGHLIGAYALCDAWLVEGAGAGWAEAATRATKFTLSAQNPKLGWRYAVRPGGNDTSMTSWAVAGLVAAEHAGVSVPAEAYEGAANWLAKVTDTASGRTGYSQRGDNGARMPKAQAYKTAQAMTGAALWSQLLMGTPPTDPGIRKGTALMLAQPPQWQPGTGTDLYYWYYGSLAMFQVGGDQWTAWSNAFETALRSSQHSRGEAKGSWDPDCAWGVVAGRVYSTAMGALILETYYRYPVLEPTKD